MIRRICGSTDFDVQCRMLDWATLRGISAVDVGQRIRFAGACGYHAAGIVAISLRRVAFRCVAPVTLR